MKNVALVIAAALVSSLAHAQEVQCVANADHALRKVAQALGMGKGVAHLGGSEVLKEQKDKDGNTIVIVGGGVLGADDTDGYLSGTGATVEMVKTKNGCKVSNISISTGADFIATMDRESQK